MSDFGSSNPQTSGSLRTKISLKNGQIVAPFHTFQMELPAKSEVNGSIDLLEAYDLGQLCHGFFNTRRLREDMSSFVPHLYGNFNFQAQQEASSLKALVEKPPIHKEISNLSNAAMQGFRLSTGPVDESYRHLFDKRREIDSQWMVDENPAISRMRTSIEPKVPGEDMFDHEERKRKHKKEKKKKKSKKREMEKQEAESMQF